jgi:hypothetical protein
VAIVTRAFFGCKMMKLAIKIFVGMLLPFCLRVSVSLVEFVDVFNIAAVPYAVKTQMSILMVSLRALLLN